MHSLLWRFENESHKSSRALQLASYGGGGGRGGARVDRYLLTECGVCLSACVPGAGRGHRVGEVAAAHAWLRCSYTHTHTHPQAGGAERGTFLSEGGAHVHPLPLIHNHISTVHHVDKSRCVNNGQNSLCVSACLQGSCHAMAFLSGRWRQSTSVASIFIYLFLTPVGRVASGAGAASPGICHVLH